MYRMRVEWCGRFVFFFLGLRQWVQTWKGQEPVQGLYIEVPFVRCLGHEKRRRGAVSLRIASLRCAVNLFLVLNAWGWHCLSNACRVVRPFCLLLSWTEAMTAAMGRSGPAAPFVHSSAFCSVSGPGKEKAGRGQFTHCGFALCCFFVFCF